MMLSLLKEIIELKLENANAMLLNTMIQYGAEKCSKFAMRMSIKRDLLDMKKAQLQQKRITNCLQ